MQKNYFDDIAALSDFSDTAELSYIDISAREAYVNTLRCWPLLGEIYNAQKGASQKRHSK